MILVRHLSERREFSRPDIRHVHEWNKRLHSQEIKPQERFEEFLGHLHAAPRNPLQSSLLLSCKIRRKTMTNKKSSAPARYETHKLGANKNDPAVKRRKKEGNFSQSKDIREDRSVRQRTFGHRK